jgi:hypothetical protein
MDEATSAALESELAELGVKPSGVVGAATVAALEHAIADLQEEAEPAVEPIPSATDTPSS